MAALFEVYKCQTCGNVVEVVHGGKGQLVCCGKPMTLMSPNTTDAAVEKHVPEVERTPQGVKVKVGSVPHPMTEEHYIEWIEVIADGANYRAFLKPGAAPEAVFPLFADHFLAREYCNLHGLWQKEL